MGKPSDLVQGTLDLLILKTLLLVPLHGWAIAKRIQQLSGEVLQVQQGSLYPALHRLERQKLIAADWKLSENKQRVRVYRLTAAGKKHLLAERSRWSQLSDAIAGVLDPAKRESEA
jgi:PadR family transcriptional regulator, regulatory protein PadR